MKNKTLIVITGPTAVGKTAFAIRMAQHFGTEIISADSRQFYHDMRIGTAYPEPEELQAVKHHFVGNLSLGDEYNVSKYEHEVLELLKNMFKRHDVVVLTGGSGLYIDAVCTGIDDLPDVDQQLRKALKAELKNNGLEALTEKLKKLDPHYYEAVDLKNPNRVLRALEVCIQSGKPFSGQRLNRRKERDFRIIKIGLDMDREELFTRIAARVDRMIEKGLLDEVRSLMQFRNANALNTVGYKELFAYLDGKVSFERAVEDIKTNTRRYAKRQLTWFKRDDAIRWFQPAEWEEVISYVQSALEGVGEK